VKGDIGARGLPGLKGDAGATGPAGPRGAAATVTCAVTLRRAVTCAFTARVRRVNGSRARLSRGSMIFARGSVRGRALRTRATRDMRPGTYVPTIIRGRGTAATITRYSVKV